jgi:uncharacterized protein
VNIKRNSKIALYLAVAICFSVAHANSLVDFFRAVNVDDTRTIAGLLERGFDPNTVNDKGQPALFVALRDESFKVAELLLAHPSIKPDLPNAANETPLMMAALRGQIDWATRLLARGAALEREGWAPLHYAASGPEPRMVGALLDKGAAIDAPSPNRSTALMMAARYGSIDAATLLLARGANPRLRNDQGLAAADFARRAGRDALAATLEQAAR